MSTQPHLRCASAYAPFSRGNGYGTPLELSSGYAVNQSKRHRRCAVVLNLYVRFPPKRRHPPFPTRVRAGSQEGDWSG